MLLRPKNPVYLLETMDSSDIEDIAFTEILSLHRNLQNVSDRCIAKIIHSFDNDALRILLLTYFKFFFFKNNRVRHLQDDNIYVHIFNQAEHFVNTRKRVKKRKKTRMNMMELQHSWFHSLPVEIGAHIISFLDQKSRFNTSKTNHMLFTASQNKGAKFHLNINKLVANQHLICNQLNQDSNINYASILWSESYK